MSFHRHSLAFFFSFVIGGLHFLHGPKKALRHGKPSKRFEWLFKIWIIPAGLKKRHRKIAVAEAVACECLACNWMLRVPFIGMRGSGSYGIFTFYYLSPQISAKLTAENAPGCSGPPSVMNLFSRHHWILHPLVYFNQAYWVPKYTWLSKRTSGPRPALNRGWVLWTHLNRTSRG